MSSTPSIVKFSRINFQKSLKRLNCIKSVPFTLSSHPNYECINKFFHPKGWMWQTSSFYHIAIQSSWVWHNSPFIHIIFHDSISQWLIDIDPISSHFFIPSSSFPSTPISIFFICYNLHLVKTYSSKMTFCIHSIVDIMVVAGDIYLHM